MMYLFTAQFLLVLILSTMKRGPCNQMSKYLDNHNHKINLLSAAYNTWQRCWTE